MSWHASKDHLERLERQASEAAQRRRESRTAYRTSGDPRKQLAARLADQGHGVRDIVLRGIATQSEARLLVLGIT